MSSAFDDADLVEPAPRDVEAALRITPHFYEAALAPGCWPAVLERLCAEFDAETANFANYNFDQEGSVVVGAYSFPEDQPLLPRYLAFENLAAGDPRRAPGMRLPNRPLYRTQLVADDAWYGSTIYDQVYRPLGLDDTLGVYLINEGSGLALGLGFARKLGARPFDVRDAERLQLYIPHLRCATRVMTERIAEKSTAASLLDVLHELDLALIVADAQARILFANRSADELLRAGGDLLRVDGKLAARDRMSNLHLRSAILTQATNAGVALHLNVAIPRKTRGVGLQATVCALSNSLAREAALFGGGRAAIFINDPMKSYETPAEQLQRLYGLTSAEADIARRYAELSDLRAIAEASGRSYETVRGHLKQVMGKIGVGRQADLVRVLAATAPPLRPEARH